MRHFSVWVALFCLACGPRAAPTKPAEVHDVGWAALTRDQQTASSYRDKYVRVKLASHECKLSGDQIQVWDSSSSKAPLVVFHCTSVAPVAKHYTIVGVCRGPVKDGVWRSPRHDYYVPVDDCVVTAR